MEEQQQGSAWVLVVFGLVFVGIAAVIIIQKIKRKGAQWTGVVIDKNMSEDVVRDNRRDRNGVGSGGFNISMGNNNAVQRSYRLRIRDDSGKEFNWPVGEGVYQTVTVGDRLQKQPGSETPTVLSKAQAAPVEQVSPQAAAPVQSEQITPSGSSEQQPPIA